MHPGKPAPATPAKNWTFSYQDQQGDTQEVSTPEPPWARLTTILKVADRAVLPAFVITLSGPDGYLMASREAEGFEVIVTKVVPRQGMVPLFKRYGATRRAPEDGGESRRALSKEEMTDVVMHFPHADELPPPMTGFEWIDVSREVLERLNPALREVRENPQPSIHELMRSDPERARQMIRDSIEQEATRHYGPPAERQAKNRAHVDGLVQRYSERTVRGILKALSSLEKPLCAQWLLKHDLAHGALDEIIKFHDLNGPRVNILGERRGRYTVTLGGGWGSASDFGTFTIIEAAGEWKVAKMLSFSRS